MFNELTAEDIKKMEEEIEYRTVTLRYELLEEVKRTRAFGDLSENFEYKMAKQQKNKNESRIRYLKNMIRTAKVIEASSGEDEVGIFDKVTLFMEDDNEREEYTLVTNIRVNVLEGLISTESPVGRAILGKHTGDKVEIQVNDGYSYTAVIEKIEKGTDDGSIPLKEY
ncbi:MAG: GreA/GreB family elongation factor [Clostridia bacterium]|nr:GreA/GreB family elongation factor [Clostridia bacterium]